MLLKQIIYTDINQNCLPFVTFDLRFPKIHNLIFRTDGPINFHKPQSENSLKR